MLLLLFKEASEEFADAVGTSAGTSTASAVSTALADAAGSSAGTATVSGIATALADAAGTSVGTATVAGVGAPLVDAAGSAQGSSTAAAVGAPLVDATGEASGSSIATAVSAFPDGASGGRTTARRKDRKYGLEPVRRPNPRVEQPQRRQPVRLPSSDDLEWLAGRRTVRPAPWQPPGDEIFAEHELPVSFHEQMQRLLDARRIDDERRRIAQQRAMARQMAARDEAEIVTLMQFL